MIIVKEDTNVVNLKGELGDELEFSHEVFGEKFYSAKIKINRLSNSYDILPMTISERLLQDIDFENEKLISVVGQLRSYNKNIDNKNKLVLTVFAREMKAIPDIDTKDPNSIFLDGYICKAPGIGRASCRERVLRLV